MEQIINEIDVARQISKNSFGKDLKIYMNLFAETLQYKELGGKIISKAMLWKNTADYFNQIKEAESSFKRLSYSFENDIFTEQIIQNATVSIKIFLFFTKKWTVEREGIYKWKKINGNWQIISVEILNEKTY